MSENFQLTEPNETDVAVFQARTGADAVSAMRSLRLQAAMNAIETIEDVDDVKSLLRVVVPKLAGVL